MALDFIEQLYSESKLIYFFKKMLQYSHCQQYFLLRDAWDNHMEQMALFCRQTTEWDERLGGQIWNSLSGIRDSIANNDNIATADKIEELMPMLYSAMELRGKIDVTEGDCRLFSSKSGFLCIQDMTNGKTPVSTIDPAYEAYEKAKAMCDTTKKAFCSLGCELGYLAWQMYEVSEQSIDVYIYEDDETAIEYAKNYGVLEWIPPEKLHVIVNQDISKLFKELTRNHVFSGKEYETVFYVQDKNYGRLQGKDREIATELLQNLGTSLNFLGLVERNFYRNNQLVKKHVEEIVLSKNTKSWIVVGGGPSVDYNIDYLKEKREKSIIIAVTTIVKRLLNEGIKPDYIIAIDMMNRTFDHVDGLESMDVPLIMSDCANWKFSEYYMGEKYIIPTSGLFFSKEIYKAAGIEPWNLSGTVTAAAIEVAARLGATKIDLVGLDLAYPSGSTHANGTIEKKEIKKSGLVQVQSVNGGMVDTDLTLKSYIGETENVIRRYPQVEFHNRSKNGALIRGCK